MKQIRQMKKRKYKLNGVAHPLYNVYTALVVRCFNPKHKSYYRYGGRGVTVCEEWLNDRDAFVEWCINNGWKPGLHLDKDILSKKLNIDPPIYSPNSCMFVTPKINSHNSTSVKHSDEIIQKIITMFDSHEDTFKHRDLICKTFNITKKQLGGYLARRGNKKLGRGTAGVLTTELKLKIIHLRELGVIFPKIGEQLNLNWSTCRTFYTKYRKGLINV
jgi:hypothetical protein